jgi:hypothetical protein
MRFPALLLALLACIAAACGCGGGEGGIDLGEYERALAALRDAEGDGQLHAARLDGGDITFDLVREGPATRVRWSGSGLEDTDDEVFAGPYFDLAALTADGARELLDAAPVEVDAIAYTADDRMRLRAELVGEGRTFVSEPPGAPLREVEPVG